MEYSQKTADLIERQCKNVERKDFRLQKKKAEELILKTYDLFGLKRPKKIVWFKDIFVKFNDLTRSAWSAGSAWSARSARSAGSAWSAWSARSARSAWSAWSAWSARSARSAGSAWSALDYDFDWYVFEYEYCQNPDKDKPPNENDKIYLEYCELLMQAKEAGLGYRLEHEDTLYLVPTPLVLIDDNNSFHSEEKPAIRWKGGKEFYYLHGVNFGKSLWKKVVDKKLSPKEILNLDNMEQRMVAIKIYGVENMLDDLGAELIDKSTRGNHLYRIKDVFSQTAYYLKYTCPSTGRVYASGIDPEFAVRHQKADSCMAWKLGLVPSDYDLMTIET